MQVNWHMTAKALCAQIWMFGRKVLSARDPVVSSRPGPLRQLSSAVVRVLKGRDRDEAERTGPPIASMRLSALMAERWQNF